MIFSQTPEYDFLLLETHDNHAYLLKKQLTVVRTLNRKKNVNFLK